LVVDNDRDDRWLIGHTVACCHYSSCWGWLTLLGRPWWSAIWVLAYMLTNVVIFKPHQKWGAVMANPNQFHEWAIISAPLAAG